MKKLAMLLVLCLMASTLSVAGFADDVQPDLPEVFAEEVAADGDDPGIDVIADDDAASGEAPLELGELSLDELVGDADPFAEAAEEAEQTASDEAQATEAEGPEGEEPAAGAEAATDEVDPAQANEEAVADATPHTDPNGPQLAAYELTLGVGEKYDLAPAMPASNGSSITLSSADAFIASVTEDGKVTATGAGDVCVTATASDGTYAECFVHVKLAPDKVSFSAKTFKLGKGEKTDALRVKVGSQEGMYAGAYTLTTSDKKIVSISADGSLKGVKAGKATIKVKTYNGKTASCKVTVTKAPDKITAKINKSTLGVGETAQMSYTLPKDTASQATFKSDNPAVAGVDPRTGVVTGVAPGKTRICAKTFNGKKSYVTVKVGAAPESLSFPADTIRLGVGMKLAANASVNSGAAASISYIVENSKIASCSGGTLKGVAKGTTTLVAQTYNGLTAQCTIEVVAAPKSVKLPYKTLEIGVKQKLKLEPDVGSSASTFTYTTSDKKIAKVSADGVVTGVKKGSATITIQTYNKKKFKLKVNVVKSSGSITLSPEKLELGIGETGTLKALYSGNIAVAATFTSDNPAVASVDAQTGVVTGVGSGETTITATAGGKKAKATVSVYGAPEWVSAEGLVELGVGQSRALSVELSPGSRSPLAFASQDAGIAAVSADGVVTGVNAGQTVITVSAIASGVSADVNVVVLPAPENVWLAVTEQTLNVGETTQMSPSIDEGAVASFTYASSNEAVATVSSDGMVVAVSKGSATLTVSTHNGKTASLSLTVLDPWFPESIQLLNAPETLKVGEKLQLQWSTSPEGAVADFQWKSSDESVATVSADGVLKGVGYGYATITAASKRNPAITLQFKVGVGVGSVVLEIPARTTSIDGIANNLAKIDAIRASAISQIDAMKSSGVITSSDASKRKSMVNNAFKDYAFPWMTLSKQSYWKKANSENGAKDFKPNRVYYGMPYISGSGDNREYNVSKALKENRYYDSGKGYYIMNQKRLLNGKYCGNDCSCFVDAAIWGTGSSHSDDRTGDIAKSSAYKTISSYDSLRTGDLICKGGSHVVMFLYYANEAKTQIMIIENGGIEPGTNTVHCMIMDVSWYTSRGYKIRRLKTLG